MPVISCPDCGRDVSTLAPVCPHCGRPSPAGMAPIAPSAAAPAQEQTLWRGTPSAIKLVGRLVEMIAIVIVVPLVCRWFARQTNDLQTSANILRFGWYATALLVVITAIRFFSALFLLRSTLYTITNQRVMIERGLLSKALSEIDLRYIDDTQFFQGIVDRLLGIGNVTIISSDKSTPTYVLHGVKDPRAIRELIRANAYQVSQREIFTRVT